MKPLSLLVSLLLLLMLPLAALADPPGMTSFVTPSGKTVYRQGNTYFVNACGTPGHRGGMRCFAKIVTDSKGSPLATTSTIKGLKASDLRSAYGLPAVPTGSIAFANNPVVAVVIGFNPPNLEKYLGTYRSNMGLPACTRANGCLSFVYQSGTPPSSPTYASGWAAEAALDVEMVSAICPQCRIAVYEANSDSDADTSTMVAAAVAAQGVIAVSNSYGVSESDWIANPSADKNAILNQSQTGSVAIVFASGDSGYGVSCPACLNTVLAVGGTKLTKITGGRGWSETAWTGAGSGCSAGTTSPYARPDWNATNMPLNNGSTGCIRRMVADVSAVADPSTGVAVYGSCGLSGLFGGAGWCVVGGTSVGAPIWAGIIGNRGTITNYNTPQCATVTAQNKIGCFLYWNAANAGTLDYNASNTRLWDVTSGTNGTCSPGILCTAGAGYDGPTGLGTPKAGVLATP